MSYQHACNWTREVEETITINNITYIVLDTWEPGIEDDTTPAMFSTTTPNPKDERREVDVVLVGKYTFIINVPRWDDWIEGPESTLTTLSSGDDRDGTREGQFHTRVMEMDLEVSDSDESSGADESVGSTTDDASSEEEEEVVEE